MYGSPEDTIMVVNYRFAVKKEDRVTLIKINDAINKLYKNGISLLDAFQVSSWNA